MKKIESTSDIPKRICFGDNTFVLIMISSTFASYLKDEGSFKVDRFITLELNGDLTCRKFNEDGSLNWNERYLIGKLDLDTMKVELEKEPKIIKKEDY
jgi:hypothetical protein